MGYAVPRCRRIDQTWKVVSVVPQAIEGVEDRLRTAEQEAVGICFSVRVQADDLTIEDRAIEIEFGNVRQRQTITKRPVKRFIIFPPKRYIVSRGGELLKLNATGKW